jgi:hypothetical protein
MPRIEQTALNGGGETDARNTASAKEIMESANAKFALRTLRKSPLPIAAEIIQ